MSCKLSLFPNGLLSISLIKPLAKEELTGSFIVTNIGKNQASVCNDILAPSESSLYHNPSIYPCEKLVLIDVSNIKMMVNNEFSYREVVEGEWTHVFDVFNLPELKDVPLWRSQKERIDSYEFNLWFARSGTSCGIHNEHAFKEVHTQIYGIGRMQKFKNKSPESIYNEVYMPPGFTHKPFYSTDNVYPYHQYYADTDCLWLAIEEYG